jgi:hypothetical protein
MQQQQQQQRMMLLQTGGAGGAGGAGGGAGGAGGVSRSEAGGDALDQLGMAYWKAGRCSERVSRVYAAEMLLVQVN